MGDWSRIETAPADRPVETCINDAHGLRNEAVLTRRGRLWYTDGPNSMYVYYAPTHWREAHHDG